MYHPLRPPRKGTALCSFCGREIAIGEEYWYCSGRLSCARCLSDLARQELLSCRCVRGKEAGAL